MNGGKGFTIVEILIAMVVLSLGLLGILGVFPAGIRQTAKIVEDTNSAIIAESALNAIKLGLHRMRIEDGADKGFIYLGEGVDALLEEQEKYLPVDFTTLDGNEINIEKEADYWVKIPFDEKESYLYPRPNPWEYEMGPIIELDPDEPGGQPLQVIPVKRVFPCGVQIEKAVTDPDLSALERSEAEKDPFRQFSYAFSIREARVGDPPRRKADHSLYELTIFIYRNFPTQQFRAGNEQAAFRNPRHQPIKIFRRLITY